MMMMGDGDGGGGGGQILMATRHDHDDTHVTYMRGIQTR